ncbi:MAG: transposase-like protein [Granulosicoccus sp.]|jgi:transposase-like protein
MLGKSKTRTEIANEYGIDRKTLYNWLKTEGIELKKRRLLAPKKQEQIYRTYGIPSFIAKDERDYYKELFASV